MNICNKNCGTTVGLVAIAVFLFIVHYFYKFRKQKFNFVISFLLETH